MRSSVVIFTVANELGHMISFFGIFSVFSELFYFIEIY